MKTVLDAVRKVESLDNMICALENMGNMDGPDAMLGKIFARSCARLSQVFFSLSS